MALAPAAKNGLRKVENISAIVPANIEAAAKQKADREKAVKVGAKVAGVWPLTRYFGMGRREGKYTILLMSTGLTFGTISALFGLNNGKIDERQYSILVTVVIASAVVPTVIAQAFFDPRVRPVADAPAVSSPQPDGQPAKSEEKPHDEHRTSTVKTGGDLGS